MKKIITLFSLFSGLIITLAFAPIAEATTKVPEFGIGSVKQLNAVVADVNSTENFILIKQGTAKKKVLTSNAAIIRVTDGGPQLATLADIVKGQKVYMWVAKKLGPKKEYKGLIIVQFLGAKVLGSQPPVAQFFSSSSQGLESTASSLIVSLSKATTKDVRLAYTISGTATGSSTDFTLSNGDLVIAAGQKTGVIPLLVTDDSAQESNETVVVTLTAATNATLGTQKVHTYTIQDNDQSGVGFASTSSSGAESATSVNFQVALSAAVAQEVRVDYTVSGTATGSGTDYTLANGTAVIAAGQTSANITATIVDDSAMESAETIVVTLSNPVGATLTANTVYTYTINDNDLPTVGFSSASSAGAESVSPVLIPVTLSAVSLRETRFEYAVTGGTAGSTTDFTLASGTLVIPIGQITANISLAVTNDAIDELDETVIITLSSPVDATLGATSAHTYTIQDNDNPTIAFTSASSSGLESVTPVSIGLTLSAAPVAEVQVAYTLSGTATGGGTDYTLANGTVTVPAGQTTANISLVIVDDAIADPNETVILTLSSPTNSTLGTNTTYTYTITDND